jgi:hypothetical protein
MDLEALGFTREELLDRVVARACDRLMETLRFDDEGEEYVATSPVAQRITAQLKKYVDEKVAALCDQHVLPLVSGKVDSLVLEETNKWGEKVGKAVPFTEYLVSRAEAYLTEPVDYEGKKPDGYGRATQTRITHMVHQHLHYEIARAMKQALETANGAIVGGINEAVRMKLAEFTTALKVTVETKGK